jgi:hypothetical protein
MSIIIGIVWIILGLLFCLGKRADTGKTALGVYICILAFSPVLLAAAIISMMVDFISFVFSKIQKLLDSKNSLVQGTDFVQLCLEEDTVSLAVAGSFVKIQSLLSSFMTLYYHKKL